MATAAGFKSENWRKILEKWGPKDETPPLTPFFYFFSLHQPRKYWLRVEYFLAGRGGGLEKSPEFLFAFKRVEKYVKNINLNFRYTSMGGGCLSICLCVGKYTFIDLFALFRHVLVRMRMCECMYVCACVFIYLELYTAMYESCFLIWDRGSGLKSTDIVSKVLKWCGPPNKNSS